MIFNEVNENKAEININDTIGFWGLTHQDFSNQLNELNGKDIQLNIASYGGVVTDAFAIYNSLKSHTGRITANIYGDSASAATFIAMAADEIRMADNVLFLVHNVQGMAVGDTKEMEKTIELMEKMNTNIVNVYKKKTGLNKSTIKKFMNNEEWWTAQEAKDNGFVDKIVEPSEIVREAELVNCVDEKLKQKLVNKLNNNKNNFKMTDENKNWLSEKFEGLTNLLKKEDEVAPIVDEQPKEEVVNVELNKEAMAKITEMVDSVKAEVESVKADNVAKIDEIAKLTAELEKANAKATNAKGENNSPEGDEAKPEVVNAFLNKTEKRMLNKFKIN